ncbi:L-threonylcarbamoyladenylate synthase [Tundrisphaera lichenicola]|uniref:L-threonylcarbamoyladenylate synthase n=1 Tax=Tundrisphaera lichenicola TaxID=2029860 RepID=UPI003EB728C2
MPSTKVLKIDANGPDPAILSEAARIIREGGLVAFATETVYGLGADATRPEAVARIFEAKGRPPTNPLIVHVAENSDALACVSHWPIYAETLAARYWPGPLTMVLPKSSIIPAIATAGQETVGIRVPNTVVARLLIAESGRPIAAPSANRSTGISPTTAAHVMKDLDGKVDLILDSGPTTIGIESTVLDVTEDPPRLLRPGAITREEIAGLLDVPVLPPIQNLETHRSPGQMNVHYSPRTPTYRLPRQGEGSVPIRGRFELIVLGDSTGGIPVPEDEDSTVRIHRFATPKIASRELYARLHRLDTQKLDMILILPPPDEPQWAAVRDRVWRASRPWTADNE